MTHYQEYKILEEHIHKETKFMKYLKNYKIFESNSIVEKLKDLLVTLEDKGYDIWFQPCYKQTNEPYTIYDCTITSLAMQNINNESPDLLERESEVLDKIKQISVYLSKVKYDIFFLKSYLSYKKETDETRSSCANDWKVYITHKSEIWTDVENKIEAPFRHEDSDVYLKIKFQIQPI